MDEPSAGFEHWISERRNEVKRKTLDSNFQVRKAAVQQMDQLDAALKMWRQYSDRPERPLNSEAPAAKTALLRPIQCQPEARDAGSRPAQPAPPQPP